MKPRTWLDDLTTWVAENPVPFIVIVLAVIFFMPMLTHCSVQFTSTPMEARE